MSAREIYLDPVYEEVLTPEKFLSVYATKESEIASVRVIPPRLGSSNFGQVLVVWKMPTYIARNLRRKNGRLSSRRERAK